MREGIKVQGGNSVLKLLFQIVWFIVEKLVLLRGKIVFFRLEGECWGLTADWKARRVSPIFSMVIFSFSYNKAFVFSFKNCFWHPLLYMFGSPLNP